MTAKKKEKEPEIIKEEVLGINFFKENNNSTQYNYNEDFVAKVCQDIFKWFVENEHIYFYSIYPRKYLGITYDTFVRKFKEFPFIFNTIEKELDLITTERLATAMLN